MFYRKNISIGLFLLITIFLVTCSVDEITPRVYPRVKTLEVNNISSSGARFNAEIIYPGNQKITEYGFVWGEKEYPNIESFDKRVISDEITTGSFTAEISTTLYQDVKYYVRSYAKNGDYLVYGKQVEFFSLGSKAAIIENLYPNIGTWEDTITIKGKNFSYVKKKNRVHFNDIVSEIISTTDSTIRCIVPDGISDKSVPVYVEVSNQIAKSNKDFVLTIPEIESFFPLKGTFGDKIEILGKNFSSDKTKNKVSFNGYLGEVIEATKNKLTVVVPNAALSRMNEVKVLLNLQSDTANKLFEILPPKVYSIFPESGFTKSELKITGDNFNPLKEGDTVILGSNYGKVISASKNELSVEIPKDIYLSRKFNVGVKVAEQTSYSNNIFTLKDPWIQKNEVPYEKKPRKYATGFSLQGYGYVGLGFGNSFEEANSDFYKYDPDQNEWEKINNFGGGGRYSATGFVIGNYAYVGSGLTLATNSLKTNDFWKFDPVNENWTEIASLPVNTAEAVGLTVGGFGYVCTPEVTDNFWKYDPAEDKWIQLPDLNMPLVGENGKADSGFAIGNKIYIYVSGNSTGLHHLYEFNTNTLQWTRKADLTGFGIRTNLVGFSIKGKGYIIDEYKVREYDPDSDTWEDMDYNPSRINHAAIEFVIDNKAYFGTGSTGGSSLAEIWEYDPEYSLRLDQ
jgi:N-acetylneuraminic acid mutarotase